MGAISVQDPFVLDHNITLNVNDKVRLKFVDELKVAAGICQGFASLTTNKHEQWGLVELFVEATNSCYASDLFKSELSGHLNTAAFYVILKVSKLPEKVVRYLHKSPDYRVEWVLLICRFLDVLLKQVLFFECEVLSDTCGDLKTGVCDQAVLSSGKGTGSQEAVLSSGKGTGSQEAVLSSGKGTGSAEGQEPVGPKAQLYPDIHNEEAMCEGYDSDEVAERDCDMLISDGQTLSSFSMEGLELTDQPSTSGITRSSKRLTMRSTAVDSDTVKRCKVDGSYNGGPNNASVMMQTSETNNDSSVDEDVPSTSRDLSDYIPPDTSPAGQKDQSNTTSISPSLSPLSRQCFETPVSCLSLACNSFFRTWNGRRVVKRKLVNEGASDDLALEKLIGQTLCQAESPSKKPVLQFTLGVQAVIEPGKTATIITLKPGSAGAKEFTCFYPFFKTFLIKAVEKYLPELIPNVNS